MGNIFCSYQITNPVPMVGPNDVVQGIFFIRSDERKEEKLKNIEIVLTERFEECVAHIDPNTHQEEWEWVHKVNDLKKYMIAKNVPILPGQTLEFPFEVRLPSNWRPKKGERIRDWWMSLVFMQKTGLVTTPGT